MQTFNDGKTAAQPREETLRAYKHLVDFTSIPRLFNDFPLFEARVRSSGECTEGTEKALDAVRLFLYGSCATESYLERAVRKGENPNVKIEEKGVPSEVPLDDLLGRFGNSAIVEGVKAKQSAYIAEMTQSALGMGKGRETETLKLVGIASDMERYASDPGCGVSHADILDRVLSLNPHQISAELMQASLYLALMEKLGIVDPLEALSMKISLRG